MSSVCNFQLSKRNDPYCSGEAVNGSISLSLASAESVKYLYIILKGEGTVSWPKSPGKSKNQDTFCSDTVTYKNEEVYIEKRHILRSRCAMEPGEYTFPFCLLLPMNCPSSFKGTFGSISYKLSVVLSVIGFDSEYSHPVNVIRKDDLNLNPAHRVPLEAEEIATFCCCVYTRGRLAFTLNIPNAAFVPLQILPYCLRIENESQSEVIGYSVELVQDIVYTASTPQRDTHHECNQICSEYCGNTCPSASTRTLHDQLLIPAVTPTSDSRSIIRITYKLKILAGISRYAKDVEISVPVHIGTVALTVSGGVITPTLPATVWSEDNSEKFPNCQHLQPPTFECSTDNVVKQIPDSSLKSPSVGEAVIPPKKAKDETKQNMIAKSVKTK